MSEFKSMKIDRGRIIPTLESTYEPCKVTVKENKVGDYTYNVTIDKEKALLAVYFCTDETTTINYKVGNNHSLSYRLAQTIKESCSLKESVSNSFYIKKIDKPDFDTVLEFIKEKEAVIVEEIEISAGKQYRIKGKHGGHLVIKYYNNNALQIQGKAVLLFDDIIDILCGLLPFKEVIDQQLKYYSTNLTSNDILGEMENILPTAFPHLHDKIKAIISPAIALKKIQGIELEDYSTFAFPALRGFEGVLKELLSPNCIVDPKNEGFGEFFEMNTTHRKHILTQEAKDKINDAKKCRWIEDGYNFYKIHRHAIFHVDSIVASTRILNRNEAEDIITRIFKMLEDTYTDLT